MATKGISMKRITDKAKKDHKDFLANIEKIKNCNCNPMKICPKCRKIILGKNYLKLISFDK